MEPSGPRAFTRSRGQQICGQIVDAYDNLQQLLHVAENDTSSLKSLGVGNGAH